MQQKQPDYLDRQALYESNARTYPRSIPVAVSRARGVRVTGTDGRTYLDCLAGAGTLALGQQKAQGADRGADARGAAPPRPSEYRCPLGIGGAENHHAASRATSSGSRKIPKTT